MQAFLKKFEHIIVLSLITMMVIVVVLATIELGRIIIYPLTRIINGRSKRKSRMRIGDGAESAGMTAEGATDKTPTAASSRTPISRRVSIPPEVQQYGRHRVIYAADWYL